MNKTQEEIKEIQKKRGGNKMIKNACVKKYVKEKGYRDIEVDPTGKDALEMLERKIKIILEISTDYANEDRRKTINAIDIERAIKLHSLFKN